MLCAVLVKEERRVLVRFVSSQSNMIMLTAGTSSLAYKEEAVRILGTAVAVVHKVQDNDSI
jgi:NCAIR mutase (PurE)-related protein